MKKTFVAIALVLCITQTTSAVQIVNKKDDTVTVLIKYNDKTTPVLVKKITLQPNETTALKNSTLQKNKEYYAEYSKRKITFNKSSKVVTIN